MAIRKPLDFQRRRQPHRLVGTYNSRNLIYREFLHDKKEHMCGCSFESKLDHQHSPRLCRNLLHTNSRVYTPQGEGFRNLAEIPKDAPEMVGYYVYCLVCL